MSDKFILMRKEKELLVYLEQYVLNSLPKNEKVLRDNLTLEMYETIKNTAKVSMNKGNVRQKYLNDVKVNIVMIDFYIGVAYSKNLVIKKRFLSCIKKMLFLITSSILSFLNKPLIFMSSLSTQVSS